MTPLRDTFSTLPAELLGEVFTAYASVFPDAPIVLGAVSRRVRSVAFSTPSVWSHLELGDRDDDSKKAALWFEQSKAHHVNVQINLSHSGRPQQHGVSETAEKTLAVSKTLQSHTDRITSFCVRSETPSQAQTTLAAIYSELAEANANVALRTLSINAATSSSSPSPATLKPFPCISTIVELDVNNIPITALLNVGLNTLRSLRISQSLVSTPMAVDDIVELIRLAPQLRRLDLDGRIADPTAGTSDLEQCFLPHLSVLHLRANNIIALLDHLILPSLRVLHLNDLDGRRANASVEMGTALHRLLVRMELGKGDVKKNGLRVLELTGIDADLGERAWQQCMQKMTLEVFTSHPPPPERGWETPAGFFSSVFGEDVVAEEEEPTRPGKAGFGFDFGF
ncbi:hypothetical protein R3P38DRAFT_2842496 [Favolaschia claudopus]|uniref:F-box domain-containing protein n=1 Tax=Favolaschia claudopus TaxID=2862362 RepID=A0AAW0DZR8_9AGAR